MATIKPYVPRELGPKSWGTELLIAETSSYIGKVLWMHAGKGGRLQYHERKDETFYLLSGLATVRWRADDGEIYQTQMEPGQAFHVPPGAWHQVTAIKDCVIVEASSPVFDDRVVVS